MTASPYLGQIVARGSVLPEWIDYNDHMNVAYYVLAFDYAIDALWARLGIDDDYIRETHGSTFAVETHVTYQSELKLDEPYVVTMELLAYDAKRIHQFQRMYHGERRELAATAEWMSLHVNLEQRRVTQWPPQVLRELDAIAAEQDAEELGSPPDELSGRIQVAQPVYRRYGGNSA